MCESNYDISDYLPNDYVQETKDLKEKYHDSVIQRREEMLMGHRVQDREISENIECEMQEGVSVG